MTTKSLRIMCQIDFPGFTLRRWDGSGPVIDADGNVWGGSPILSGIDVLEMAINGEATAIELTLIELPPDLADGIFQDHEAGNIVGSRIILMIQRCDEYDQPFGPPRRVWTGRIDNIRFDDEMDEDGERIISEVTVECVNRFTLRRLTNGSVLSDADQRARSLALNPDLPPDRFCDRVHTLADKTIRWPRYKS